MKLSFKAKVLFAIGLASVLCTGSAVMVSNHLIAKEGVRALTEKSNAILSRLRVGASYVAKMNTLGAVIDESVKKFPDGRLSDEQKEKVLKSVPIYAAFKIGGEGAKEENYEFRVAAQNPRNPDNKATAEEEVILEKFKADPNLKEYVEETKDGNFVKVSRPVRIAEAHGCLNCHGSPEKSPWHNGKDVLGYKLESMKDGDLKGMFTIISSLAPVKANARDITIDILEWGLLITLIALAVGFIIIKNPLRIISLAVKDLDLSSNELSNASNQITSVSETLSSSSAEAASALQETVASTEELSSMVKLNSDHAREAAALSQQSTQEAEAGEIEIRNLNQAMSDISASSKKIEEIINVIDDIAFQTNLLALNAAVEAARAGEQGKGFAVVADAVRGLAQRSATAAKDITVLIRDSVEKIEKGSKTADAGAQVLKNIVGSVKKVSALNAEISSASSEQSNGITQISKAMSELDNSTQSNAASAQEASASSEEMSAQAAQLKQLVGQLVSVLEGAHDGIKTHHASIEKSRIIQAKTTKQSLEKTSENVVAMNKKKKSAADLIPFDDETPRKKIGTTDGF